MQDKHLSLNDNVNIKDDFSLYLSEIASNKNKEKPYIRSKVELFTDEEDGVMKLKWTKSNMMVLAGGGFLAKTLFNFTDFVEITPSYNTALNLDETVVSDSAQTEPIRIFGFCVGTDGCGRENSQIFAPKYASWISPNWSEQYGGIVPLMYREQDDDLTDDERKIYFGRKTFSNYYGYYFKTFDSDPILIQQYLDGTPIGSDVYDNIDRGNMGVETVVTMQMSISKEDVRGAFYYGLNGQTLNDCRINTISLVMGWPRVNSDGYTIWNSIRPVTRLNFSNEGLLDARKSILIRYSLYF